MVVAAGPLGGRGDRGTAGEPIASLKVPYRDCCDSEVTEITERIISKNTLFGASPAPTRSSRSVASQTLTSGLYHRAKMAELLWLVMDHLRRTDLGYDGDIAIGTRAREEIECGATTPGRLLDYPV